MGRNELYLFKSCLTFYTFFYLIFNVFNILLPWGLVISLVVCGSIFYFRIPSPDKKTVNKVLGLELTPENIEKVNSTNTEEFVLSVGAHRGCGLDSPENSLSAARKIAQEGCTLIEFDVVLTADGVPVVFHDDDLSRITDMEGRISRMTLEQLEDVDIAAKHPFSSKFSKERIPTLDEMLKVCLEEKLRMIIDLKGENNKMVEVILHAFNKYPDLVDKGVVSSFNPFYLYQIRQLNPRIVCTIAWRPHYYSYSCYSDAAGPSLPYTSNPVIHCCYSALDRIHEWLLYNAMYYVIGVSAILLHKDTITWDRIHYWKKRNVRVISWTVNLPSEKQYFAKVLFVPYLTDTMIV